jgi:predicted RNase H-like HicB family nuclease
MGKATATLDSSTALGFEAEATGQLKADSPSQASCALCNGMKAQFTYWKESDGRYLGYLNSHPDHWTQGDDLEDLKAHLRDLHEMFAKEEIPGIRSVAELELA